MMKANYHTHTARCGHAEGMDEEYVRRRSSGDLTSWVFRITCMAVQNGYVHPTVRMHISQMPEYLASVRALAEKYRGPNPHSDGV